MAIRDAFRKMKLIPVLLTVIFMFAVTSCVGSNETTIKGDRNIKTAELALSSGVYTVVFENFNFNSTNARGKEKITINESLDSKVLLKTDGNIAETIDMSLDGAKIVIKGDKSKRYDCTSFEIEIGALVNNLQINSSVNIDCVMPSLTEFTGEINATSSGNMKFGQLDDFSLTINGTASFDINGKSQRSAITLNGTGSVDAFDFHTVDTVVKISGTANANVYASGTLNAAINGTGAIVYDGSPETVDSSGVTGTGTIKAR